MSPFLHAASGTNTLLLTVLVTLKATGTIDWSWWWVLAPFWIPLAVLAIDTAVRADRRR